MQARNPAAPETGRTAQLALVRYNGPGNGDDNSDALAVSAATGSVFVTGASRGVGTALDMATLAVTF